MCTISAWMFAKPLIYSCRVCLWTGPIQPGPDSQGNQGSPWPEFVILMDTRLPSRQKGGLGEGPGGGGGGGRVMKTIHLVTSLSEREPELLDVSQKRLSWCVCADLRAGSLS